MIASEPTALWTYWSSDIVPHSDIHFFLLLVTYVWQTCVLTCYMCGLPVLTTTAVQ